MANVTICDKCGKICLDDRKVYEVDNIGYVEGFDLCTDCADKLVAWFDYKIKEDN